MFDGMGSYCRNLIFCLSVQCADCYTRSDKQMYIQYILSSQNPFVLLLSTDLRCTTGPLPVRAGCTCVEQTQEHPYCRDDVHMYQATQSKDEREDPLFSLSHLPLGSWSTPKHQRMNSMEVLLLLYVSTSTSFSPPTVGALQRL